MHCSGSDGDLNFHRLSAHLPWSSTNVAAAQAYWRFGGVDKLEEPQQPAESLSAGSGFEIWMDLFCARAASHCRPAGCCRAPAIRRPRVSSSAYWDHMGSMQQQCKVGCCLDDASEHPEGNSNICTVTPCYSSGTVASQ